MVGVANAIAGRTPLTDAIRNTPPVSTALTALNGIMPSVTALPGEIQSVRNWLNGTGPQGAIGAQVRTTLTAVGQSILPSSPTQSPTLTPQQSGDPIMQLLQMLMQLMNGQPLTPTVPTPAVPTPAVPTPAVPTPAVPTPAVPTPAVPTPAVPTPAVTGPIVTPAAPVRIGGTTLHNIGHGTTPDGTALVVMFVPQPNGTQRLQAFTVGAVDPATGQNRLTPYAPETAQTVVVTMSGGSLPPQNTRLTIQGQTVQTAAAPATTPILGGGNGPMIT